jgi:hypothetical protein
LEIGWLEHHLPADPDYGDQQGKADGPAVAFHGMPDRPTNLFDQDL